MVMCDGYRNCRRRDVIKYVVLSIIILSVYNALPAVRAAVAEQSKRLKNRNAAEKVW